MTQSQQEKDADRAKTLGAIKRSVITTVLLLALTGIMILYGNFVFDWKMLILLVIIGFFPLEIQAVRLVRQSFAQARVAQAWIQVEIEQMWDQRMKRAITPDIVRRLGTVGEARALITKLIKKDKISDYALDTLEYLCQGRGGGDVIGDPNDVHVIIPPRHTIGYAIQEGPSGVTLETVETHDDGYYVLRHRGAIVRFEKTRFLRNERWGPVRYG